MRKIIFTLLLLVGCAHTPFFEDPEYKAQVDKITNKWRECIFENVKELSNYSDDIFNIADSAVSFCREHKNKLSTFLSQEKYLGSTYAYETAQRLENKMRENFAVKIAIRYIKMRKEIPFYPAEDAKWVKLARDYYIDENSIEKKAEGIYFWSKVSNKNYQIDDLKPIDYAIICVNPIVS